MFVISMLADAAQVQMGKLHMLGGGIDNIPVNVPFALVVIIDVGWDETNQRHDVSIDLVDGDGRAVLLPTVTGPQPFSFNSQVEVGRPPGIPVGMNMRVPLTLSLSGLPLEPGRYQFRIKVNGKGSAGWDRAFSIVAQQ